MPIYFYISANERLRINFSIWMKRNFCLTCQFLETFKFAVILVLQSHQPGFEVSRDVHVGSGTHNLGRDISDLKTTRNFASELSTSK